MGAETGSTSPGRTAALALGALGIVFGDIGTSPIYAFRESFERPGLPVDELHAYGVASLVLWSLVVVVSVKYLTIVMRADNRGEGGVLALTALVERDPSGRRTGAVVTLGVFGTALLFGDGLITPAISVLSAVEGFAVASDAFSGAAVPIAAGILFVLFAVQRFGTAAIANLFGPVIIVWFTVVGALGLRQVVAHPAVLRAVSPTAALDLVVHDPWRAFVALGSIFLVVTGGEALYADMGHFGRRPIAIAWYSLVLPGLVLSYFGQAALVLAEPAAIDSPFYRLAPAWGVLPLAVLATIATVIASQALISGAFSLAVQAVQLDLTPRLRIVHTSPRHIGQVYVPAVNWALMVGSIGLVVGFRSSSGLASAYGIAVTSTMLITTLLVHRVARQRWNWSAGTAAAVLVPLLVVDLAFLGANIQKVPSGGWFPLVVGAALVWLMTTWRRGRRLVAEQIHRGERSARDVVDEALDAGVQRVPGTAVYLFKSAGSAPPALVANLAHNHVLHENTLLVSVEVVDEPRCDADRRAMIEPLGRGVHQVVLRFGFTEEPDVPAALRRVVIDGHAVEPDDATYFVGRESVTSTPGAGMHVTRERAFAVMARSASSATRFFGLPAGRVFEVGSYVEI